MGMFDGPPPDDGKPTTGGGMFDGPPPGDEGGSLIGAARQFAHGLPVGFAEGLDALTPLSAVRQAVKATTGAHIPGVADITRAGMHHAGLDPGKPQGFWEGLGKTAGEFAGNPLSWAGPGRLPAKAATTAMSALGSEAAGQVAKDSEAEPWARLLGAIGGGMAPSAIAKGISPGRTLTREQQFARDEFDRRDIPYSAGQLTESDRLKRAEGELGDLPGSGGVATEHRRTQSRRFTEELMEGIGERIDDLPWRVVARGHDRITTHMNVLERRNRADWDRQAAADILNRAQEYEAVVLDPSRSTIAMRFIDELTNHILAGPSNGEVAASLSSRLGRAARQMASRDPDAAGLLFGLQQAVHDMVERSIAIHNPADLGAWRQVRNQYRNLLPLERVIGGAGPAAARGDITPQQMRAAITDNKSKRRTYAHGEGDYGELVRAGNILMSTLPNSMTSARSIYNNPLSFLSSIPMGVVGGRGLWSPPGQWLASNQAAKPAQRALRESHPGVRSAVVGAEQALSEQQPDERLRFDVSKPAGAPATQ